MNATAAAATMNSRLTSRTVAGTVSNSPLDMRSRTKRCATDRRKPEKGRKEHDRHTLKRVTMPLGHITASDARLTLVQRRGVVRRRRTWDLMIRRIRVAVRIFERADLAALERRREVEMV